MTRATDTTLKDGVNDSHVLHSYIAFRFSLVHLIDIVMFQKVLKQGNGVMSNWPPRKYKQRHKWKNEFMNKCMNEWMNEWMYKWMNEWMNEGGKDGRKEWMNEYINEFIHSCLESR